MVTNGRRCVQHIPIEWFEELERNSFEIFKRRFPSKILNVFHKVPQQNTPIRRPVFLGQSDIDKLLQQHDVAENTIAKLEKKIGGAENKSETPTHTEIPKQE
jgi:hypothetical protein